MKKILAAAGVVMTVAATGIAGTQAEMFVKMDANGDQKLTKEEYLGYFSDNLSRNDVNKDGVLTYEEFPKPSFKASDTNKDGKLTPEEFEAMYLRQFDGRDKNKDGVVTIDEMIGGGNVLG